MRTVLAWILVVFGAASGSLAAAEDCRWDTPYLAPVREPVTDVAVGDGVAVALGESFISWSPDGVVWFQSDLPFEAELRAVTWTGDQFVAVGAQEAILISDDGVEWMGSRSDRLYPDTFDDVSGFSDEGVLVTLYGGHPLYLLDPESPEDRHAIEAPGRIDAVVSNGSTIVAAGDGAWVTHDRQHWERIVEVDGHSADRPHPSRDHWEVQWNGRFFVAVGPGGIARSLDGVSWTRAELDSRDVAARCPNLGALSDIPGYIASIPEGSSGDWIVLAETDPEFNEMRFPVAQVCSIQDAFGPDPRATMGEIRWDTRRNGDPRINAGSIAGVDFLLGYTGAALGEWSLKKLLDPLWIDGVDWIERHGDEWVRSGHNDTGGGGAYSAPYRYSISVSRDLLSWEPRFEDLLSMFRPLHLGNLWLIHGYRLWGSGDWVYTNLWSVDLRTFAEDWWFYYDEDHVVFPDGDLSASSGGRVVVISTGLESFEHALFTSTDLREWTIVETDETWRDVTWTGQRFVAVAENGIAGLSLDGEEWTEQRIDTTIEMNNVESGGGVTVAMGQRRNGDAGFVFISDDHGSSWRSVADWRGFGEAESGALTWIGDRFVVDTPQGTRQSEHGLDWTEPVGLPLGRTVWGGLAGGERTLVRDRGVVFYERCSGKVPFAAAEDRRVLPVTASVLGSGGQPWGTAVSIANTSDSWQRVAFSTRDRQHVDEVYLPPRAQTSIGDLNALVLRSRGRLEAVEIASSFGVAMAGAIAATRDEGRVGQGIPDLADEAAHVGTEPLLIAGLAETAAFRTNLGVANLGDSELMVSAEVRAPDGAALGSLEIAVPAHEVVQRNRVLRHLGAAVPEAASVVLRTDEPDARYAAWASVVDNRTNDPSFRLAVAASGDDLVVPVVADVRGAAGEHWRTSMDIFNPGDRSARISVRSMPGSRFPGNTSPAEFSIPAGTTVSVANVMAELFDATGSAALLMDVLEGEVVASSRTWQGDDGTVGQGIPATAVPDDLQPGDRLVVAGLHESDDRRTNLGLVNLEPFAVRVRLTLWSSVGDEGPTHTITLPPESLTQHNAVLADWPEPRPSTGWAEIEILDQPARVLAWSSVVDRGTSDPTYHQAQLVPVE
jgi:hypothetical protein